MIDDRNAMRTNRARAHYADRAEVAGKPVATIKSSRNTDFLTLEEFAQDLYDRPVDHVEVIFKEVAS